MNPNSDTIAEEELSLIRSAQSGDSAAFCDLCRLHGNRLVRHATMLCGDSTAAEDLVQESLLEAWRSIPRFKGQCQIFTWLCSIMLHRYRNLLRKKRPIAFSFLSLWQRQDAELDFSNVADGEQLPSEAIQAGERALHLMQTLDRLPPKQRAVVYLRFYADESLEEIAAALGCSVGTVKSRLFSGLQRLRKMKALEEEL